MLPSIPIPKNIHKDLTRMSNTNLYHIGYKWWAQGATLGDWVILGLNPIMISESILHMFLDHHVVAPPIGD